MNRREFGMGVALAFGLDAGSGALARTVPPLSAWGALPAIEQVALSDDATRLAFVGISGDARRLVLQTIDGALLGIIGLDDAKVIDIQWAGNDDIVVTTARTLAVPELGLPLSEFYSAQAYSLSKKRFIKLASRVPKALGFVLRVPEIRFFSGWDGEALLGVGALKRMTPEHGEVKSMHTAQAARRRGVGAAMLRHIIAQARAAGMARVSLETGTSAYFAGAVAMYLHAGFTDCPPFGDYSASAENRFLTLELAGAA